MLKLWYPQKFEWKLTYFTCGKFLIVSLTKNLLANVRHTAALMFSFGNCQLSSIIYQNGLGQNYFRFSFVLGLCSSSNILANISRGIEQDRIMSVLLTQKSILTFEYSHNLLQPINECTIFQRIKLYLAEVQFVVKLFRMKKLCLEIMP